MREGELTFRRFEKQIGAALGTQMKLIMMVAVLTNFLLAQTPAPVPLERRGPAVGARVPDFRLRDQTGRWRDLESLRGPSGLVLLFVRSAD